MNATTLAITTLGIKGTYDAVVIGGKLLKSTTKALVNVHKPHQYELSPVLDRLDLIHKIKVINCCINKLDEKNVVVNGVIEILTNIENITKKIQMRIETNKQIWFIGKTYLDDLITDLEKQNTLLDSRFNLLTETIQLIL